MSEQPPKILRIKRKRHQDPLQALILEDKRSAKRSKPSTPTGSPISSPRLKPRDGGKIQDNYVFTLTRTDDSVNIKDETVVNSILAESQGPLDIAERNFVIPKHQVEEDIVIPNELSDMVSSVLTLDNQPSKRKRRGGHRVKEEEPHSLAIPEVGETTVDDDDSQYVYDVYQLTISEPLTSANHPQSLIGYIKFFDDANDENLLTNQEDTDSIKPEVSDDEDSNTESFYQNDYPSDEDAGVYSDVYEEEEDEGYVPQEGVGLREDEYFEYEEVDFSNVIDNEEEEEDLKRNVFFESDKHDPMAIYRDKIFGKLERMINES
ncbi:RNA polymerase II nuclear localization protein IWR1 [Spathaspora sp. JA1]|nr:RNA polymerase II nuclear localization protein IWR1 [Spathaspora sp. JA1]